MANAGEDFPESTGFMVAIQDQVISTIILRSVFWRIWILLMISVINVERNRKAFNIYPVHVMH
jgi:hypothetical protein